MGLRYTGESAVNPNTFGENIFAYDGEVKVVVEASNEAIQDYGREAVLRKGSEKYTTGDFEPEVGNIPRKVTVRTSDFPPKL